MHHFASCAKVVQTFCPLTRQPPFSRTAFVLSEARSEPDSGSENPWHQISSAERIGSRKRSFWSSLPWAITTGPPITSPSTFAGEGALERAISSLKMACSISDAPRPPYSFGHEMPAHPASCILRCQSRRKRNFGSSPSGSGPGWFSSSQVRTSSRKASSSGVSVRSIAGALYKDRVSSRTSGSVRDVEHDQRDADPRHPCEDHARVLSEDGRGRAHVAPVVDQVEVTEDPVEHRWPGREHLASDQRAVHGVDRVADDRPGGDQRDQ